MNIKKKILFLFLVIIIVIFSFLFYKTSARSFIELFSKEENTKNRTFEQKITDHITLNNLEQKEIEVQKPVYIIFVGDIMLSRNVDAKIKKYKDYNYPYKNVNEYLKTGDIVFGNLETAITPGRAIKTGEMTFRADPENAIALKENGFSVLSLANNHTPNFGEKGLKDTINYLTEAGIKYVGAGNKEMAEAPATTTVNGLKFAFLAYNSPDVVPSSYEADATRYGTNFMDTLKMQEAVKKSKLDNDFVIVSMHAGVEYKNIANKYQSDFAHAAIDAGAEMVIGHHPHVVQNVEKYKDKYIIYSLGNFIFDQMWSQNTREGMIAKFTFDESGVINTEFKPVIIYDYSQPKIVEGEDATRILSKLQLSNIK